MDGSPPNLSLPETVAQHHDLATVGRVFLRREGLSQRQGRAIHAEVAFRNMNPVFLFGMAAGKVIAEPGIVE